MPSYSRLFPWRSVDRKHGFFVPCLNTEDVRQAGLKEALRCRVFDAQASIRIKDGKLGVWFYRATSKGER
jgi:hypothetical protein